MALETSVLSRIHRLQATGPLLASTGSVEALYSSRSALVHSFTTEYLP